MPVLRTSRATVSRGCGPRIVAISVARFPGRRKKVGAQVYAGRNNPERRARAQSQLLLADARRRPIPHTSVSSRVSQAARAAKGPRALSEQPPPARRSGCVAGPPELAEAPTLALPPALELPPSEQSPRGVKPACAQSLPSTSDRAGQPASQVRATGLSLSHESGPRTHDMCSLASK